MPLEVEGNPDNDEKERVEVSISRDEIEALRNLVEELSFAEKVERGKKEIEKGKSTSHEELKNKYGIQ